MAPMFGHRASAPGRGAKAWRVTGLALIGALLVSALGLGGGAASARTKNRSGHRPRTGRKDDDLGAEMLDNLSGWLKAVVPRPFAESRGNLNCDSRFLKPILK